MTIRRALLIGLAGSVLLAGCSGGNSASQESSAAAPPAPSTANTAVPESSAEPSAAPSPAESGYAALLPDARVSTAGICAAYESRINNYQASAKKRSASGEGSTKDPYKAAAYRRSHDWVRDPLVPRFEDTMQSAATAALNELSDGQAGLIDDIEPFLADSLTACGLDTAYSRAMASAEAADSVAQRIKSRAADKPWYPKGYDEVQDGIAIRWVNNAGNDCYDCVYWTIDIIPRDGCPNSLYVELSIEKNGAAIGYTNDVLGRVRPGQRGRMSFESYDDAASNSQGSITEVSCY